MEFKKPAKYYGKSKNISFKSNSPINHEQALTTYDRQKVKAILQLESGNADVMTCLDIANMKFGHHPCVIGYGIDAEWYFHKQSADETGVPLRDADVERWVKKVISFNPEYTLFLKHWEPAHMPRTFRHSNLWFLSDSQDFKNILQMMEAFRNWGKTYKHHIVGFQFGYQKDSEWWKNMDRPTTEISHTILRNISNTRFLFWVDFTADQVSFGQ